jgi:hypothetical protein
MFQHVFWRFIAHKCMIIYGHFFFTRRTHEPMRIVALRPTTCRHFSARHVSGFRARVTIIRTRRKRYCCWHHLFRKPTRSVRCTTVSATLFRVRLVCPARERRIRARVRTVRRVGGRGIAAMPSCPYRAALRRTPAVRVPSAVGKHVNTPTRWCGSRA